ncbi:MAG TPA: molybdopterin molybdotransferase MoeA [Thermomicrobiales bacterium]|nr:molybdopterin molybdotransferase MoeA [Thermomicrobiales bacterium]HRA30380.1 molybdopterin molybdotransferase MoeA [Thermomicrobiales bacterium]
MTRERTQRNHEAAIGVDEALARILTFFSPLPGDDVPLLDGLGRALAADVRARNAAPPFRNSAMDGYAIRSGDTVAPPVTLRVVGRIAAGQSIDLPMAAGEAIRITTGAPTPRDADAVVRFEDVHEHGDWIDLSRSVRAGDNIRLAGEDIPAGAIVAGAGAEVTPAMIGSLASAGISHVMARRRPSVAILSTGNEVVEVGGSLTPGSIWNSNAPMLAALVRQAGGTVVPLGIARDSEADIRDRLLTADMPDLFITSGGVSVGDYDLVKDVLREEGSIDIWQVAMKPGRPLAFGTLGTTPLLGLPGNPVAAWVSFLQFGWPAIRRMLGFASIGLPEMDARLAVALSDRAGRRSFVRGIASVSGGAVTVRPTDGQGSAMLGGLAQANCLIVIPETYSSLDAEDIVRILILPGSTIGA